MHEAYFSHRGQVGLTTLGMLTVIAMLAILLTIAVPSFRTMLARSEQVTAVNTISAYCHYARSEAIKLKHDVVICPSDDQVSCLNDYHWHLGFLVYADEDSDGKFDGNEEVIRLQDPLTGIEIETTPGRRKLRFQPDGTVTGGSNATFSFCVDHILVANRALVISNIGRVRLANQDPDGSAVSCD